MERNDDVVDLGAVAEVTHGPGVGFDDGIGEQIKTGLTDE